MYFRKLLKLAYFGQVFFSPRRCPKILTLVLPLVPEPLEDKAATYNWRRTAFERERVDLGCSVDWAPLAIWCCNHPQIQLPNRKVHSYMSQEWFMYGNSQSKNNCIRYSTFILVTWPEACKALYLSEFVPNFSQHQKLKLRAWMQAGMKCELCRSKYDFLLELLGSWTFEYVIGTTPNKLSLKRTMDNSNRKITSGGW